MKKNKKGFLGAIIFGTLFSTANANSMPADEVIKFNNDDVLNNQNMMKILIHGDTALTTTEREFYEHQIKNQIDKIEFKDIDPSKYYIGTSEDVIFFFETRGIRNFWNTNDLGYPAVTGFQLHLAPGYPFEDFINYLRVHHTNYYQELQNVGGINAARRNNKDYINKFQNLCDNEEFFSILNNFVNKYIYGPKINHLKNTYGIDISHRHPAVQGIIKTFIGNRSNDIYKIAKNINNIYSSDYINTLNDYDFVKLFEGFVYESLNTELKEAPRTKQTLKNNYKLTFNTVVYPNLSKTPITEKAFEELQYNTYMNYAEEILTKVNLPKQYAPYIPEILSMTQKEVTEIFYSNKEEDKSIPLSERTKYAATKYVCLHLDVVNGVDMNDIFKYVDLASTNNLKKDDDEDKEKLPQKINQEEFINIANKRDDEDISPEKYGTFESRPIKNKTILKREDEIPSIATKDGVSKQENQRPVITRTSQPAITRNEKIGLLARAEAILKQIELEKELGGKFVSIQNQKVM